MRDESTRPICGACGRPLAYAYRGPGFLPCPEHPGAATLYPGRSAGQADGDDGRGAFVVVP